MENGEKTTIGLISKKSNFARAAHFFVHFFAHRRTGNFLPEGAVNHLPKKLSQVAQIFTKQSSTKRNEGHTLQQHGRTSWHMKVAYVSRHSC